MKSCKVSGIKWKVEKLGGRLKKRSPGAWPPCTPCMFSKNGGSAYGYFFGCMARKLFYFVASFFLFFVSCFSSLIAHEKPRHRTLPHNRPDCFCFFLREQRRTEQRSRPKENFARRCRQASYACKEDGTVCGDTRNRKRFPFLPLPHYHQDWNSLKKSLPRDAKASLGKKRKTQKKARTISPNTVSFEHGKRACHHHHHARRNSQPFERRCSFGI